MLNMVLHAAVALESMYKAGHYSTVVVVLK